MMYAIIAALVCLPVVVWADQYDPHVGHIVWDDGKHEDIPATTKELCEQIPQLLKQKRWVPVNRIDHRVKQFSCEHYNGFAKGSECIKGMKCAYH